MGREIITVDEALRRVLDTVSEPRVEGVPLLESVGRVLAEPITCAEAVPARDNSAMDGFGVRRGDLDGAERLRLVGDSLAGRPWSGTLGPGECARVMTGGLIPDGADTVVPVELTSGYEPEDGHIAFHESPAAGANIRRTGSVRAAGDELLAPGTRIRPGHVGVLAQQGYASVSCGVRPRVAVVPTGDEVVPIEATPGPGQVRNSNAYALVTQIRAAGGEASLQPVLRDEAGPTTEILASLLAGHDLVCTIGGVSMGTRDLVRGAFAELGGEVLVESTKIKPGKPTLFGRTSTGRCLLGLPGNPASSFTIFALLGAPWVGAFQGLAAGARQRAAFAGSPVEKNWRLQALPGRLRLAPDGVTVESVGQRTSADLFSLAEADALFLAPADAGPKDGDLVDWVELP